MGTGALRGARNFLLRGQRLVLGSPACVSNRGSGRRANLTLGHPVVPRAHINGMCPSQHLLRGQWS